MVVMVDVVVDALVVIGKKIVVVEVVDEDYLMVVEVVEEDCLMNVHTRFGTPHRQGLDYRLKDRLLIS